MNATEFYAARQGTLIEGDKLYRGCPEFMSCRTTSSDSTLVFDEIRGKNSTRVNVQWRISVSDIKKFCSIACQSKH